MKVSVFLSRRLHLFALCSLRPERMTENAADAPALGPGIRIYDLL